MQTRPITVLRACGGKHFHFATVDGVKLVREGMCWPGYLDVRGHELVPPGGYADLAEARHSRAFRSWTLFRPSVIADATPAVRIAGLGKIELVTERLRDSLADMEWNPDTAGDLWQKMPSTVQPPHKWVITVRMAWAIWQALDREAVLAA